VWVQKNFLMREGVVSVCGLIFCFGFGGCFAAV